MGEKYSDKGTLGTYQVSEKPFPSPSDVKFEGGYGASAADLERGFIQPDVHDRPEYDKANYADRLSQPRRSTVEQDEPYSLPADYEFRQKDRETTGLLTRPRLPIER